ncbi:diacylglycerol kinase [Streptomyces durbertensis]|uniref:Diacylglycerol kinase n=1 Tax=Streptomyces durbertensis TaxID=2448886 RepID=A0ABR6ED75_9ACTN|nr:diacylglycerol kinase family protein [Streptomyces durbertensis]MBB1242940.1 diacylglycerol kinase [Streptomyces durbertensis]
MDRTRTPVAPPSRAIVVANPASGSHSPRLLREVAELCGSALAHVETYLTTAPGDATRAVRHAVRERPGPRPDLVVAVGGDGTVREVVQGLAGAADGPGVHRETSPAALAIVPGGTGNSGYRMIWGDRPWDEALKAVVTDPGGSATIRRLDLALLAETGNLVFLGACSGVIADALPTARTIPLHGRARYARAFAQTAEDYPPYPGRVTVDGEVVHEGPTVLANVGGGRYRGGQYEVLPHSELDDGLLDVCAIGGGIPAVDVPELTRTASHLAHPATAYGRGRTIVVERLDGARLPLEHDGEYQETIGARATFTVQPHALPTWAPAQ